MSALVLAAYRLALRLLPSDFRRTYAAPMLEEARLALEEAASAGSLRRAVAWARLALDLAVTLTREWGATLAGGGVGGQPGVLADVRFALRSFRRAPGFTATVVLTLGLGMGANTAIFSVLDATLLRPLPYDEPDRLVAVWSGKLFSRALMDDARRELSTLEDVGGYSGAIFTLAEGGDPVELFGLEVTPNHFRLLGADPVLGRGFVAEDGLPGAEPVVVLSHGLWVERFGGDPDVLGRSVGLQTEAVPSRTVVGVMGADYRPIRQSAEAFVPVVTDPAERDYTGSSFMEAVGRLRPGVDRRSAHAEVVAFAGRQRENDPGQFSVREVAVAGVLPLAHDLAGGLRFQLIALTGAVGLVLLIACANVANLLLARAGGRGRELGIRTALGARRGRLFRQLMTESVVLSLAGGLLGVATAYLTRDLLLGLLRPFGTLREVVLDVRVLGFTFAVAVGAGMLFGIAPALGASRRGVAAAAHTSRGGEQDRRGRRLQHVLMAVEVSLALVAVFAAGLLYRSVQELAAVPPGFEAEGALTVRLTAPPALYPTDEDVLRYFDRVRAEVAAVPGAEHVGLISRLPLAGGRSEITIYPEGFEPGPEGDVPSATHRLVSPGYAEAMRFSLREGRLIEDADTRPEAPMVGYVNATMADRFWPDGALGKAFIGREGVRWLTVVGVVEDVREDRLDLVPKPAVYIPHRDWAWRTMSVVVRTSLPPRSLLPAVEQAVWSVEPSIPVTRVRTLDAIVRASTVETRVTGTLFGLFAALAMGLGAVGVYGVVSHGLGRRRREFGVRLALGASGRSVTAGAVGRTAAVLALGLGAGAALTPLVGRALSAYLQGVEPGAPWVVVGAALLLGSVALGAAWIPARRAARVDPVESLRTE